MVIWCVTMERGEDMRKRIICLMLAVLVGLTAFSVSFSAVGEELGSCKKVYAYSGTDAAYFYGYYGGTLVSEKVLPDDVTRSVTTDGVIRMVCHNAQTTCALLKTRVNQFSVLALDMNSGRYTITALEGSRNFSLTGFAADDAQIYIISPTSTGTAVSRFDKSGNYLGDTSLPREAVQLFCNDGSAYGMDANGDIYQIDGNNITFCANANPETELRNAGAGYLYGDGKLICLYDGSTQRIADRLAVRTADRLFTDNDGQLLAAAGRKKAVFDGSVVSVEEAEQSEGQHSEPNETSVSKRGDLNGTGTVNGADVTALMNHLIGKELLSGNALANADMNNDGSVDNRDLVILAQQ